MNKQYKLRSNTNGLYFTLAMGFVSNLANASLVDDAKAQCLTGLGFAFTKIEVPSSFAVCYVRKDDKVVNGVLVQVKPDANKGQIVPSKRRFATADEAWQHGTNARTRKANKGDAVGSAGHIGFFITETYDKVNSAVNWKSGLTNSITV